MQTNRISEFQDQDRSTLVPSFQLQAFTPCPQALFPGAWALDLYALAYAQARTRVEVRRPSLLRQVCWN
jgi:hypothetical protein